MPQGLLAIGLSVADETIRVAIGGVALAFLVAYLWRRRARLRRERRPG
jgi:hypothetical protein